MKEKMPTTFELMKQQGVNELLKSILSLADGNLQEIQRKVLHAILIENKTTKELRKSLPHLPALRHEPVFRSGISDLCRTTARLLEIAADYKKVIPELHRLRKEKQYANEKLSRRAKLTPEQQETLGLTLEQAGFSARIRNSFNNEGIVTIADVVGFSRHSIRRFRNTGTKSVNEIEAFLKSKGLDWGMNV
jgi:hypothetical protein